MAKCLYCDARLMGVLDRRWVCDDCQPMPVAEKAVRLAVRFGGFDGAHHKAWVIDQMVRALTGDGYDAVVADARDGDDGPNTYHWDVGVSP